MVKIKILISKFSYLCTKAWMTYKAGLIFYSPITKLYCSYFFKYGWLISEWYEIGQKCTWFEYSNSICYMVGIYFVNAGKTIEMYSLLHHTSPVNNQSIVQCRI